MQEPARANAKQSVQNHSGIRKNYGKEYEGIIRSAFVIDEEGKITKIYSNVCAKNHAFRVLEEL